MSSNSSGRRKDGHVEVTNLTIEFENGGKTQEVVNEASITIQSGEFVSLIGPSGCGKSTILNAVAGFVTPTRGAISLDGKPITSPGADRGVVFQQYSLFPWQTVLENVEFGLKLQGTNKAERHGRARHLLGLAGLSSFESHYPHQLSGGMQQRVGILRALATNPRVLLMDEPFSALDSQTRIIMQQVLTDLWEALGISVLFITHDIDEAIFLSDRVYVMSARPGTVKQVVDIPLARPRVSAMTGSQIFLNVRSHLRELISEESKRTFEAESESVALPL